MEEAVVVELMGCGMGVVQQHIREKVRESMGVLLEDMLVKFQKIPRVLETLEIVKEAAEKMMGPKANVPEVDLPKVQQKYKLMFNHKCLALGCMEPKCDLCEANPRRRCRSDFDKKYFKGDILKAKCGGSIYIELVDAETEERVLDPELDRQIAMSILDGNRYDHLFPHSGPQCGAKGLEMCALLTGNEGRPLLQSQDRTANKADGQIVVTLQRGMVMLPDLSVQYSSEALLSGRRPPFRLLVQLISTGPQDKAVVIPVVSDGFVVASGRSRLAQKKHIPSVDDPVARLENMGKERVKKLRDLRATACVMGVDLPEGQQWKIIKVGDFRMLALNADKDGQLRQKMLHILKMSEKAWDETRDHALMAVTNDTRMRAWYRKSSVSVGLVYSCYLGETDLDRAVALIEEDEIHLKEHLTPDQRNLVRTLQKEAYDCWWQPGHPGWTFYPFDSESFKQSPSLLAPPKKDYGKSVSMEISMQDQTMVNFSKSEALPGRPLVPVLQSTPLSATGRLEDAAKEREEFGEDNKRIQMEGMKSQGSQRKIQSPFEEEERQLSILQGVSSFKSYCSTSGKYVPHDCSPESYNSFPPSQLYQHEKDGIVQHVPIARRDRFGKESKCPVSSGFEVQHETLLTDFNKMFKKMRQGDNGSEDSADVDLRRYAWPSSEQKSNQDFKNPRRHKSVTCAGFPSKIRQSVGLQGLKACILSDEAPEELHVEGKVCKLNPSVERGFSKKLSLVSKSHDRKRRHIWRPTSRSDVKQKDSDGNFTDCFDENKLCSISRAPKRLRAMNGVDRRRAGQSLEIPPSLSQR